MNKSKLASIKFTTWRYWQLYLFSLWKQTLHVLTPPDICWGVRSGSVFCRLYIYICDIFFNDYLCSHILGYWPLHLSIITAVYINLHTLFPSPSFATMDPPPNAMLKTSGIQKLVVTPPHFTLVDASLGNPFCNTPTSVVVPPISTTMASLLLDKNAAPRMLLVAPEENVKTGNSELCSALHCGGDNELIENKIFNCFFKPFLFNFSLHAYMYIINFNYTTI